jgi:hypothetical protein
MRKGLLLDLVHAECAAQLGHAQRRGSQVFVLVTHEVERTRAFAAAGRACTTRHWRALVKVACVGVAETTQAA